MRFFTEKQYKKLIEDTVTTSYAQGFENGTESGYNEGLHEGLTKDKKGVFINYNGCYIFKDAVFKSVVNGGK